MVSSIATWMCWPVPDFSRAYSAAQTACAEKIAVVLSQTMVRIICGRLVTGCDWISANPESPWMIGS